jgi:diguanylate cyclase (GGDEF)-like protein/PAS domain S-box-containing protein
MANSKLPDGLIDVFADAVLVVDGDGRIRFANAGCVEVLGYEPTELIGRPVEVLVPPEVDGHAGFRRLFAANPRARGMGSGLDLHAVRKDGEVIAVDITLSPFEDDGEPLVVAAVRDMRHREGRSEILRVQATALESAANGIVITTRAGIITWANPAACRMTGYTADELEGQHTRILKSGEHPPELYKELWETVLRGEVWSGTIINRRKDGSFYHEEQTIAPVVDGGGEISHFIAIKQDVSVRVGLEKELQRLARVDTLTGCANRHHLLETANSELVRAQRFGYPVSVAIFDLDRFKSINDRFGHQVGDRVLRTFVERAQAELRGHDILGRYGGEEFVALLPHADIEGAFLAAERIRTSFAAGNSILPEGSTASVSGGVAEVEPGSLDIHRALQAADRALYRAKEAGRNRIARATEEDEP